MSLDEGQNKYIGYLLSLAKEGKEDRGALAELRSGMGKEPGRMARVHKHVVPHLPGKDYDDRLYYLIATLFGSFPEHRKNRTLGSAFGKLKDKSESMETRFVALLNAHQDDLGDHLRHTVSLLKSNQKPFDWFRLFEDLLQWDHPEGHVQLRWARDFYSGNSRKSGAEEDSSDASISKQEVEDNE